jgi:hypothetical protein
MAAKKKTTKKQAKPKTKVVYRTKKVYVEREDDNPMKGVGQMVATGAGAMMTMGVANAVIKGMQNI